MSDSDKTHVPSHLSGQHKFGTTGADPINKFLA